MASLLPSDSPLLHVADGLREAIQKGAAKADYDKLEIRDGDQIEIVKFMGGG